MKAETPQEFLIEMLSEQTTDTMELWDRIFERWFWEEMLKPTAKNRPNDPA